jgi:hypothetical protein
MQTVGNMKAVGNGTCVMEKALNVIQMATLTSVTSKWEKLMEKACIHGSTEKFTMENGVKVSSTATEFGEGYIMILISENGLKAKHMGMEYTPGRMVTDMRANGICA